MPRQESIRRERGGNRFVRHTGIAAPYMLDNVSTDIPSPALTDLTQGLGRDRGTAQPADPGATAFANVRYLADGSENGRVIAWPISQAVGRSPRFEILTYF